jgi:hypothetical protein
MRLTLERFGGLAGLPAKPLILDTSTLPTAQAEQVELLAQRVLDESHAGDEGKPPAKAAAPKPDSVSYELTIEASKKRKAIPFDNAHASEALRELVKAVRTASSGA